MVDILQMVEGLHTVALLCSLLDLLVCYHSFDLSALLSSDPSYLTIVSKSNIVDNKY